MAVTHAAAGCNTAAVARSCHEQLLPAFSGCAHPPPAQPPATLRPALQATALVYLKRVYVHHCCLDTDPTRTMLTCIYLAAKVPHPPPALHLPPAQGGCLPALQPALPWAQWHASCEGGLCARAKQVHVHEGCDENWPCSPQSDLVSVSSPIPTTHLSPPDPSNGLAS